MAVEARLEKSQLKAREAYQQASKNGLFVVLLKEEVPNNHLLDVQKTSWDFFETRSIMV